MSYIKGQPFKPEFVDPNTGKPLSGGTVEFYFAGTSTPTEYHTDQQGTDGGTSLTLNAAGKPATDIFYDDEKTYKFVVKTSSGALVDTIDDYIPGAGSGGGGTGSGTGSDPVLEGRVTTLENETTALDTSVTDNIAQISSINADLVAADARVDALETQATATLASITSNSADIVAAQTDITALQSSYTDLDTDTTANTTAVGALDTRVTNAEGTISTHSSQITQLQTDVSVLDVDGNAAALSALDSRVTTAEGSITSNASDITSLQADVISNTTDISNQSTAATALEARVTSAEGTITSHGASITTLEADVTTAEGNITANTGAISNLSTRVTTTEGNITAAQSDITSLQTSLSTTDGNIVANTNALSGIDTRLTTAEGTISTQASDITVLQTSVGSNTASISTLTTSVNGVTARWEVKTDVNDLEGGIGLFNNGSEIVLAAEADKFEIINPDDSTDKPFQIIDGSAVLQSAFIGTATIDTAKIAGNAVTMSLTGEKTSTTTISDTYDTAVFYDTAPDTAEILPSLTVLVTIPIPSNISDLNEAFPVSLSFSGLLEFADDHYCRLEIQAGGSNVWESEHFRTDSNLSYSVGDRAFYEISDISGATADRWVGPKGNQAAIGWTSVYTKRTNLHEAESTTRCGVDITTLGPALFTLPAGATSVTLGIRAGERAVNGAQVPFPRWVINRDYTVHKGIRASLEGYIR